MPHSKRESLSEGTFEADLEDALDTLGIFDERSTQRSYRSTAAPPPPLTPGNPQPREREVLDNPLAPTTSNTNLRTSLLVGGASLDSRDLESSKEESGNGFSSASFGSHPGGAVGASSVSSNHHLSLEGSEYGRQSETEFRLFLDRDPQSVEKRRSHPRTNNLSLHHRQSHAASGSSVPEESVRDRIKRNLSLAFGTKERFRNMLPRRTTSIPNDFIFKDYLPQVFAEVRETCEIDPIEYFEAFQKTTKEKFSEGRSGAFLYFSANQKFIVKTTTKNEINSLLNIMKEYLSYLIANPNSLLVRFLGAHSLTMYGRVLYFVVMLNVFSKAELSERYDLKGSWVQRHGDDFVQRRLKSKSSKSSAPLYKDNDLQHKITLNPEVANALHDQIFRDTAFLTGQNISLS